MFSHLLVPTDGSKLSDKAIAHAIAMSKAMHSKITFFHATPGFPRPIYAEGITVEVPSRKEYLKSSKEEAQKVLDRAVAKAKAAGVACATMHSATDTPWEAILAAAKKAKADAIVMASHGRRGIVGLLLGSETTKVLTHGTLPVLVVR